MYICTLPPALFEVLSEAPMLDARHGVPSSDPDGVYYWTQCDNHQLQ